MDEDEEVVDNKAAVDQKCEAPCSAYYIEYLDCSKRIDGSDGHCTGQYLDYIGCIDHCVSARPDAPARPRALAGPDYAPHVAIAMRPRSRQGNSSRAQSETGGRTERTSGGLRVRSQAWTLSKLHRRDGPAARGRSLYPRLVCDGHAHMMR